MRVALLRIAQNPLKFKEGKRERKFREIPRGTWPTPTIEDDFVCFLQMKCILYSVLILIEHIAYGMFRFLDVGFCIFVVFVFMFRLCLLYFSPFVSFLFFSLRVGPAYGSRSVRRLWWLIGRLRLSSGSDNDMSCAHVMFMSAAHVLFVGVPGRPTVPEHQRT